MNVLKHIWRGLQPLPRFGPHPGNGVVVLLVLIGCIAATHWLGGLLMFVVFGPLWLYGAYERSIDDPPERYSRQEEP